MRCSVDIMIQARVGSTRLPGKVLLPLGDTTVLGLLLRRVKRSRLAQRVLLLTSSGAENDVLEAVAREHEVLVHRGSETDLIQRYLSAADRFSSDAVVRITGDCPFMDPLIVDDMIRFFAYNWPNIDFLTNCNKRTFARGLDVELLSLSLMKRLDVLCKTAAEREHVVPYVEANMGEFRAFEFPNGRDDSHFRLTIDTEDDYVTLQNVFALMGSDSFSYEQMIQRIASNPECITNQGVRHKAYSE